MVFSLSLCTLFSTVSFADPRGRARELTERGIVSLADVDVLTPEGSRIASGRIQEMAQGLCLQIVNRDDRGAASSCVSRAVRDAQWKLDALIQARLAEREAHALASAPSAE
jgi:UrcA family protein